MEYKEYPKMLEHPSYDPGSVGTQVSSPSGFSYFAGGRPVRFPPITVHNADDEEYYLATGYKVSGYSDPAAYARAHAVAAPAANYVPQEYPKWRDGRVLQNAEEEHELYPEPEEDLEEPPPATPLAPPAEDDELASAEAHFGH